MNESLDKTQEIRILATHIVDHRIGFRHNTRNRWCMHNLSMNPVQACPERAEMHLKLVDAESSDTLQERIKMILEPTPHLSGHHPMRRRRIRHSVLNRWEVWELTDRGIRLRSHISTRTNRRSRGGRQSQVCLLRRVSTNRRSRRVSTGRTRDRLRLRE